MPLYLRLLASVAIVTKLYSASASAESASDPETVLATVNGTDITLGHVIALRADLPEQYDRLPASLLFDGIVKQLVNQTLLVQAHDGDVDRLSDLSIENERRAIIAGEVISDITREATGESALRTAYDEMYPPDAEETEFRASHILVATQEEAETLIEKLENGAEFAALAREHSTGPSSTVGGDLGWFGDGDMVPQFFEAVAKLSPGEISGPVETQFGWHVIRLSETREKARPELETIRHEIEAQIRETALEMYLESLEAEAEITIMDTSEIDPELINRIELLEN